MLVFGHAGITLGAALLIGGPVFKHCLKGKTTEITDKHSINHSGAQSENNYRNIKKASWLIALSNYVDIRLLLIASLLSDIIDKPIGVYLFKDTFDNGRIFSHTLLFFLLITIAGLLLYRYRQKNWLLVLSFGIFVHLILDEMWNYPHTLLWPLYGVEFDKRYLENWLATIFQYLMQKPLRLLFLMQWLP